MSTANTSLAKATGPSDEVGTIDQQAIAPAVDITESDSGITLLADMPGVSRDQLTLKVEGDNLQIEGRARLDVPDTIALVHREVRSPFFRRTFTLSRDLDAGRIEATLRHGVLRMHIPKSEAARPRRIEVKVS